MFKNSSDETRSAFSSKYGKFRLYRRAFSGVWRALVRCAHALIPLHPTNVFVPSTHCSAQTAPSVAPCSWPALCFVEYLGGEAKLAFDHPKRVIEFRAHSGFELLGVWQGAYQFPPRNNQAHLIDKHALADKLESTGDRADLFHARSTSFRQPPLSGFCRGHIAHYLIPHNATKRNLF